MANKKDPHRPPHLLRDETYYFITSRTLDGPRYINSPEKKKMLIEIINKALKKCNFSCQNWVVLDNHYQLIIYVKESKNLGDFIKSINGASARMVNKIDKVKGRKIWYQYWDKCLEGESDFWTHVNYNHYNPVKHGYVNKMEDYEFSSYREYLKRYGKEFMDEYFEIYPVRLVGFDD